VTNRRTSCTAAPERYEIYNIFLETLDGWNSPAPPLSPNDGAWADWAHPDGHRVWWDGINGRFGFVRVDEFNADLHHYASTGRGWKDRLRHDLKRVMESNMSMN